MMTLKKRNCVNFRYLSTKFNYPSHQKYFKETFMKLLWPSIQNKICSRFRKGIKCMIWYNTTLTVSKTFDSLKRGDKDDKTSGMCFPWLIDPLPTSFTHFLSPFRLMKIVLIQIIYLELGKGKNTKSDEFSEKFQTAFEKNFIKVQNPQYRFLDWK